MKLKATAILLLFSISIFSQNFQTVTGKVFNKAGKVSIAGANVTIAGLGAVSDSLGEFIVAKVPTGRHILKASYVGYKTIIIENIVIDASKQKHLEIGMETGTKTLGEVQVHATPSSMTVNPISAKVFSVEETQRFAASFYDPARLAMSFAGVTHTNDQNNNISVRGTSPDLLGWRLEGIPILNPNHLTTAGRQNNQSANAGGGTIILSAQMLDNSQFIAGGLDSEMSNNAVGVFDMHLRKGNSTKAEHTVQAGLLGFDFSTEGPFSKKGKASYLVNYRYSFTGLLAKMGVDFGGESIGYQDLSVNINLPAGNLGNFTTFLIGGSSYNNFNKKPIDQQELDKDQNDIFYDSKYLLAGITHQKSIGKNTSWSSTVAFNKSEFGNQIIYLSTNNFNSINTQRLLSLNSKFESFINSSFNLKYGINFNHRNLEQTLPSLNGASRKEIINFSEFIPYLSANYVVSNHFRVFGGLNYQNTKEPFLMNIILPNLGVQYVVNNKLNFTINYSEQQNTLFNQYFKHLNFAAVYQKENNKIKAEVYFMNNPEIFSSIKEKNYQGIELSYEKTFKGGFYSLANISFFNGDYFSFTKRSLILQNKYSTNLTLGKEWKKNKKNKDLARGINTRFFLNNPSGDNYEPNFTNNFLNIDNQENYFRIDARLYSKRQKRDFTRTWSIDLQNVTSQKNLAYYSVERFANKKPTNESYRNLQLGLIPVINYRVEF